MAGRRRKSLAEYFKIIAEEKEIGYYRKTVSEMIQENSSAKKKKREMEEKKKEHDEEADKSKKDQRENMMK